MAENVGVGHASPMCTEESESTTFKERERENQVHGQEKRQSQKQRSGPGHLPQLPRSLGLCSALQSFGFLTMIVF